MLHCQSNQLAFNCHCSISGWLVLQYAIQNRPPAACLFCYAVCTVASLPDTDVYGNVTLFSTANGTDFPAGDYLVSPPCHGCRARKPSHIL